MSNKPVFSFHSFDPEPCIGEGHADAKDILKGFEGGCVVKEGGVYHGFFTERVSHPRTLLTRLGHWTSADGRAWRRAGTLYESTGNGDGTDPRATLFAPMVAFNEAEDRWDIFYVAYIYDHFPARGYTHQYGRIWRGRSVVKGRGGISGPYEDVGVILKCDGEMQPWEGKQGVDSFFPFKAGDRWLGFYGSAKTEVMPQKACSEWYIGLAEAPALAGPWKRRATGNPVNKLYMSENPLVYRINGWFVAIGDLMGPGLCYLYTSQDGVNWEESQVIPEPELPEWIREVRTPLCLLETSEAGVYECFVTGYRDYNGFASMGRFRLRLEKA